MPNCLIKRGFRHRSHRTKPVKSIQPTIDTIITSCICNIDTAAQRKYNPSIIFTSVNMSDNSVVDGSPAQNLFFQMLHSMLDNEKSARAVEWADDGKSFYILSKQKFVTGVLPLYFGQAKYTSFTRRLKRWGFKRTSSSGAGFYNEKFHRDMKFDMCDEDEMFLPSPSKHLPPKKRQRSLSIERQEDVTAMPELMRSINRQKRQEKKVEGNRSPPMNMSRSPVNPSMNQTVNAMPTSTSTNMMSRGGMHDRASMMLLEYNVDAAQALVSLGQQESPPLRNRFSNNRVMEDVVPYNYSSHMHASSFANDIGESSRQRHSHHVNNSSLYNQEMTYNAYTNLQRRVMADEMTRRTGIASYQRPSHHSQNLSSYDQDMVYYAGAGLDGRAMVDEMTRRIGLASHQRHIHHTHNPPSYNQEMAYNNAGASLEMRAMANETLRRHDRDAQTERMLMEHEIRMRYSRLELEPALRRAQSHTSQRSNSLMCDSTSVSQVSNKWRGLCKEISSDNSMVPVSNYQPPERQPPAFNRAA